MDLNKVMIIGRLTRDPELRTTPNGASVCQIGLATNYVYTNQQNGQKVEQVEYHNIVLWRKLAEIANQYLKKGRRVYIEGRLTTRSWDAQDGTKRSKTEIVADNMIMLDGGQGGPGAGGNAGPAGAGANSFGGNSAPDTSSQSFPDEELPTIQQGGGEDISVEDIPF
ncbi:MAG TPA: single-stranded DNA-binding protein [Patescibacteria group bacterium]|jgi:single-strand DNA-binding protein|nr:single-stranded DNA-binding protein [Patescibacteria group bacterium]